MARGYKLESQYDALRAINRKMYSRQIKNFSGLIQGIGFNTNDAYRLIIASLKDGIYQNLGSRYSKTYYGKSQSMNLPKSAKAQDYMSPMELRLNSIAVRRAEAEIRALFGKKFTLKNVQDICYAVGSEVASTFAYLKDGGNEFNLRLEAEPISANAIIKRYDKNLTLGTLPKGMVFDYESPEKKQEKAALILENNRLFGMVKKRLIELGLSTIPARQMAFARFNGEYYETDAGRSHTLEITKIILSNHAEEYISIPELKMNCDKLKIMLDSLNKTSINIAPVIYANMEKAGSLARHIILQKYNTLPELYSGFYHTYIDADRKLASTSVKQ